MLYCSVVSGAWNRGTRSRSMATEWIGNACLVWNLGKKTRKLILIMWKNLILFGVSS